MTPNDPSKGHLGKAIFDSEGFIRDFHDVAAKSFLSELVATQMFDRFCEDRVFHPNFPEVLFFDQSINQKVRQTTHFVANAERY